MDMIRDKIVKDAKMNSSIQNMFSRGELRKDHPLQRKPGRWSKGDKDGLIVSVLRDEDIDSVKVCEEITPNGVILWLIDGLQRLTTLNEYKNNVFKLGNKIEFPTIKYQKAIRDEDGELVRDEYGCYKYTIEDYDLRNKYYNDLPSELKDAFDSYKIDIIKHLDCNDEEIGYHIRRYNKQKSMNASENAITYMDNIARDIKRISSNRFFKDFGVYTETERLNGTIERVIMESIMCMYYLDDWKKNSKTMGAYLNKNISQNKFIEFNEMLDELQDVLTEEVSDLFNSKNSFIWIATYKEFKRLGLDNKSFNDFLIAFKNGLCETVIDDKTFYEIDKKGSTKDKTIISNKIEYIKAVMNIYFNLEDNEDTNVNTNTDDNDKSGLEESEDSKEILEFVREMIDKDITEEDVSLYEEVLSDLTVNVDNNSALLNRDNHKALIAIVAYSFIKDIDLDNWIVYFFNNNHMYRTSPKDEYNYMVSNLNQYRIDCMFNAVNN